MNDRDKDIALAKAMGWSLIVSGRWYTLQSSNGAFLGYGKLSEQEAWQDVPRFGDDWQAIGLLLGYMTGKGYDFRIELVTNDTYMAQFSEPGPWDYYEWDKNPQRAIRDAALKALGVDV